MLNCQGATRLLSEAQEQKLGLQERMALPVLALGTVSPTKAMVSAIILFSSVDPPKIA